MLGGSLMTTGQGTTQDSAGLTPADPAAASAPTPGGIATLAGHPVARIGFGAMQLEHRAADPGASLAILRQAVAEGVNHIDTAQFYQGCNALISDALSPYPETLVLVSKVGAERDGSGKLVPAQQPEQLRAQVEANLATLRIERVDVVNLRRLDAAPGIVAEGDQLVDLDDQLAELTALRDAGKIGGIGLSSVSTDQVTQAQPAGIACVQNLYSVIDRTAEPVLDRCREHGIAWVPFFPLGSAFPGRPRVTDDLAVIAIAAGVGATPAQVALAWLLSHYDQTLLIPGTASPAHLSENIAAGSVRLPAASVAALDQLAAATAEGGLDR
jgi:aryl-alcohol dehydrogenase-like predicted oxidoreductase